MEREPPSFKMADRVYFKNKQPGKWDLKWRPGHRIVLIECDGHYLHIENQATGKTKSCNVKDVVLKPSVELWNIDTEFGRAARYINHPCKFAKYHAQQLKMNTLLMYTVTYKWLALIFFPAYYAWSPLSIQQPHGRAKNQYCSKQYQKPTPCVIPGSSQHMYLGKPGEAMGNVH